MQRQAKVVVAIDVGASSGRHVAGVFDGERLTLEEVHRFPNGPVSAAERMHWDLLAQWDHVGRGLRAAAAKFPGRIISVGVDTWGVDFALLGRGDELLGNPVHYRDPRTDGMMEAAFAAVPRAEIFAETGLQFMQFNTLYQLLAMRRQDSPLLDAAETLLMMPDLFHWLLTGEKANERTNATTTQFYNPRTKTWAAGLLEKLDLPTRILGRITAPGTRLGSLRRAVADATGLAGVDVVLPGTHDTASAVMGVPAAGRPAARPDWCYISSGTWSLMGVEVHEPVITDQCLALNFTNEGGVGDTTRLLKNIAGMWLVQECRRAWNQAGADYRWDDLTRLADQATPLLSLVDPDDADLLAPADMPQAIRDFCRRTGQTVPADAGAVIRCALESLALKYRQVHAWLEQLAGGPIGTIHVVGGGTQNRQLCQMAADACQRPVVAGPVEATAIGNLLVQLITAGEIGSIADAREVIRRSFPVVEYHPRHTAPWDEAYAKFRSL